MVTFLWNRPVSERVIVMNTAKTRYTADGAIADPENPAKRLKIKGGVYSTSDPDEIAFLKAHEDFDKKHEDGFSIKRELTLEEEVESLRQRHNLSQEDVKKLVGSK